MPTSSQSFSDNLADRCIKWRLGGPTSRPHGTMKMLHALVGYLTVTALPFYSFAFAASPLASINYDGYANKTHIDGALIKQVLDSIVEACQTLTTPKHDDSTIMKRHDVSGDMMEARQELPPPMPTPVLIGLLVAAVVVGIIWIVEDDPVRGNDVEFLQVVEQLTRLSFQRRAAFTQNAINSAMSQYPKLNWVICHSPYTVAFDGVEGTDYGHYHYELQISFYRTIGFEFLTYLQYFCFHFFHNLYTDTIFIGQSREHSIDMEMEDISTYVPFF